MSRLDHAFRPVAMVVVLEVTLISGKGVTLETAADAQLESLRLLNRSGNVLDGDATLESAGVRREDVLTLHIGKVQTCGGCNQCCAASGRWVYRHMRRPWQLKNVEHIQTTNAALAAILCDGSVVTWGNSCPVQDQLKNVQQIQATFGAFAAILGDARFGGNSSRVQEQLKTVQQMQCILWWRQSRQAEERDMCPSRGFCRYPG